MKIRELVTLKKDKGQMHETSNYTVLYNDTPGVWFVADQNNKILEVAQTSNLCLEINSDIKLMTQPISLVVNNVKRQARRLFEFSERFPIYESDASRTVAKWRDIAIKSSRLSIYCIDTDEAWSTDKGTRERIEAEIAVMFKAPYFNAWGKQRKYAKVFSLSNTSDYIFNNYFEIN